MRQRGDVGSRFVADIQRMLPDDVDRVLDTVRTTVNVVEDRVGTAFIARVEGGKLSPSTSMGS